MTSHSVVRLGHLAPRPLLPLLRSIADLKRTRSAGRKGSIAERLFASAWAQLASGRDVADVLRSTLRDALAASHLGDLDPATLADSGIPTEQAWDIWCSAASKAAGSLDLVTHRWVERSAFQVDASTPGFVTSIPGFVTRLIDQPRAGATCHSLGRLVLEPPESHADHCLAVAVFGVILAPTWDADPDTVFLAALAHHLHNALLPDSGFVGEMLLGKWLQPAMESATTRALAELPATVRARAQAARSILPDADTPDGRAFHAADTLDRVLQVEHHLRAAGTSMEFVLRDMELVHAGPVKPFQDAVLEAMGLAA